MGCFLPSSTYLQRSWLQPVLGLHESLKAATNQLLGVEATIAGRGLHSELNYRIKLKATKISRQI